MNFFSTAISWGGQMTRTHFSIFNFHFSFFNYLINFSPALPKNKGREDHFGWNYGVTEDVIMSQNGAMEFYFPPSKSGGGKMTRTHFPFSIFNFHFSINKGIAVKDFFYTFNEQKTR
jgi:hypothetical protein